MVQYCYLPPELVDHILSYLWNDKSALSIASLISPQWHPLARSHLFHTFEYHTGHHKGTFEPLIQFLSNSMDAANDIRELALNGCPKGETSYPNDLSASELLLVLESVPRLVILTLDNISFLGDEELENIQRINRLPPLPKLKLRQIGSHKSKSLQQIVTTIPTFYFLLSIFHSCKDLSLHAVRLREDSSYYNYNPERDDALLLAMNFPKISPTRVEIDNCYQGQCIFSRFKTFATIENLQEIILRNEYFLAGNKIIRDAKASLTSLLVETGVQELSTFQGMCGLQSPDAHTLLLLFNFILFHRC